MPQSFSNPHKGCGGKWIKDQPCDAYWFTQKCLGCGKRIRQRKGHGGGHYGHGSYKTKVSCQQCQSQIQNADAKFCDKCGTPILEPEKA